MTETGIVLVNEKQQFYEILSSLASVEKEVPFFMDTETTGLDWFTDKLLLVQCLVGEIIYVFDIRAIGEDFKSILPILEQHECIFHNAKFDLKFLRTFFGSFLPKAYCTLVAESILNAGKAERIFSLKGLVQKYCKVELTKETREEFYELPEDAPISMQMLYYAADDVKYLPAIYEQQWKIAEETKEIDILNLESNLVSIVAKMEYTGIKLDESEWIALEKSNKDKLVTLEKEFVTYLVDRVMEIISSREKSPSVRYVAFCMGIPVKTKKLRRELKSITDLEASKNWLVSNFNIASNLQMKKTLNYIGISVKDTNEKTLAPLGAQYPEIAKILSIREVGKSVSTYGLKFLENVHPKTGRVHTEYFTGGTATGRFSSNSPNMQNIPRSGGFRECFVPDDDYVFISCDYSQQEYRLAGAVSKEPEIIEAYKNGFDMHTATASIQFGVDKTQVTKEQRNLGKTLNFAILYGSSEFGLHRNLKVPLEQAKKMIATFFGGYPKLKAFKDAVEERILQLGYSRTPMGRRRYNLEKPLFMDSGEFMRWRERVKREGFNLIIQGGGADIMKLAILNMERGNVWGDKFRILLQIHDELLVEVHKSIKEEAFEYIKKTMVDAEQPFLGEIPAVVEGEIKEKWTK